MPMKPSRVNMRVAARDVRRGAFAGAHQAVDEPGLAAEFGGHPTGGVGDVGKAAAAASAPTAGAWCRTVCRASRQRPARPMTRDEDGAESDHDVEAVVEQRDIVGPLIARERVEAVDFGAPSACTVMKLSMPGMMIGLSSCAFRRRAGPGWRWARRCAVSKRPSMAASVAG